MKRLNTTLGAFLLGAITLTSQIDEVAAEEVGAALASVGAEC